MMNNLKNLINVNQKQMNYTNMLTSLLQCRTLGDQEINHQIYRKFSIRFLSYKLLYDKENFQTMLITNLNIFHKNVT